MAKKEYDYTVEGLTALIMEAKKDEYVVVKWNIHSDYSSIDEDYPSGRSDKVAYSMVLPDHVLVVEEDAWRGEETLHLTYAGSEGFVPTVSKDDERYETLENALDTLANETHDISISGKRSMGTFFNEDMEFAMKAMYDNVHYFIDGTEILHEAKTPYTEEFFNGEHDVSTCLNGNFADICCEKPLGVLAFIKNPRMFTDRCGFEEAVREAVR